MRLNYLKSLYHAIFGYKITENMKKFIDMNKQHWNDFEGTQEKGYVLAAGMKNSATYFTVSARVAKSIEEETGCLPIVLLPSFSFSSKHWIKIYESYNIKRFLFYRNYSINIRFLLKSLRLTLRFFLKKKNVDDLLKLKCEDIYIGDLIYDTILRNTLKLYTIEKIYLKYFGYIFSAFLRTMIYKKIFNEYNIKYLYTSITTFTMWGILIRVADKYNAIVIRASRLLMKNFKGLDICEGLRPRESDVEALKEIEILGKDLDNYFIKRFSGAIHEIDVFKSYKDKTNYSKESLCEYLNISINYPFAFIMAHAFADGSHITSIDKLLFRDYYVWLIETLKYISQINNVNWIIKPHPLSYFYGETGEVERLVNLYNNNNNLHLTPNDLNTGSIKNIADIIITVSGTAGMEFGCFGVPVIITGHSSYSGFGFTIEPKTVDEYFELLKNILNIPKLTEQQIKNAKTLAAIMFIYSRTNDPLMPWGEKFIYTGRSKKNIWDQTCSLMTQYNRLEDEFYLRVKDLLNLNLYKKYLN